jgi:hypothetical protein
MERCDLVRLNGFSHDAYTKKLRMKHSSPFDFFSLSFISRDMTDIRIVDRVLFNKIRKYYLKWF